ncbi:MAG: transcription-repair coupling factor [Muribaculaceae bacterium]|nr:transcription-repair coupling factor [Muribaculaceae bacterium]
MTLNELTKIFSGDGRGAAIKRLATGLKPGKVAAINGAVGSALALTLATLPHRDAPYIIVADDADSAGYLYNDLEALTASGQTLIFPSGYKRDIRYGQTDAASDILRTEVINQVQSAVGGAAPAHPVRGGLLIVTYPEALAEKVADRRTASEGTVSLAVGDNADPVAVVERLVGLGFQRVDYVYEPGQVAMRGSIVDVYSFTNEWPFRLDFFGDEVDSIRTFDVETQLSKERLECVAVMGNQGGDTAAGVSLLEFAGIDSAVLVTRDLNDLVARVRAVGNAKMSDSALIAGEADKDAMRRVVDPDRFEADARAMARIEVRSTKYEVRTEERGEVQSGGKENTETQKLRPSSFVLHTSPQGVYHKNFDLIAPSFADFLARGYRLLIGSDNPKQLERLRAIFADRHDSITFEPVDGTLHEGFVDDDLKVCFFTDHQIFDRFHKYTLRSERARSGKLAMSLRELQQIEVGDYIVHEDHGIGRFGGLLRTSVNGTMQEMIKLTYQGGDQIFVSIHSLHKLSKYRGKEGEEPHLHKLGSGAWHKLKSRTKSRLKDIARDLIKLYAERRREQGFAFSPDGYMQHELEASFAYEDTPDQLTATRAVKADMESPRPMDRLICGDVGFGKTEIAIRAAFKAAVDGKQTAVLVPTTVLAFQHWNTFSERLKDFPVKVDYLSRARTPKQVKQVLADLADGKIDIIIGTHKLIGKTVRFKDLGLLVIDEEQKFGVAVKEKLKQLKVNVDTLTMSATPIPRTLQFSLMGARDLSAITTPPANRQPILTTLATLDDDTLTEALNFELSRGGQVFIVNNRIEGLARLENMVRRLVPDARVVTGHGQMPPERLEQIILDFAAGTYDVLIATTIIENGVDMPNVNTIIVNNAQSFGLSELHQLRGRVGRSSRKAFCYLMVPPGAPLTEVARRRLRAIESFSDLGSGIHIAMQDLDIRGAGNLLGAEQSGFIADLGYETYQKILAEAVLELKTEEFSDTFADQSADQQALTGEEATYVNDCVIDTDLELMFPASWVPQEGERINLYRELDAMTTREQVEAFEQRMVDRFGAIPPMAAELIRIVPLRRLACRLGIVKVVLKTGVMYIYFVGEENVAYYRSVAFGRILNYLQQHPKTTHIRQKNGHRSIVIDDIATVSDALDTLRAISALPAM